MVLFVSTSPDNTAPFRKLPLFEHASEAELEAIDSMADEVHIPAGRAMVNAGQLGREFVLIMDGEARVELERVQTFSF